MSDRDDRVPRLRISENHEHMATCSACLSKFDSRLFVGCPYCAIENARRNRRASDRPTPPAA